ncbi:MAG: zinc ribbon domain-containing protein [Candidatus Omnitrophica bacterium]|nr:zinc ribbon domain-containing protein [Candidatus Omnitrophota bacterium]
MPLYEYECQDCKERFVVLIRKSEDENSVVCSKCASKRIKRLLSTFSASKSNSGDSGPSCPCAGSC